MESNGFGWLIDRKPPITAARARKNMKHESRSHKWHFRDTFHGFHVMIDLSWVFIVSNTMTVYMDQSIPVVCSISFMFYLGV